MKWKWFVSLSWWVLPQSGALYHLADSINAFSTSQALQPELITAVTLLCFLKQGHMDLQQIFPSAKQRTLRNSIVYFLYLFSVNNKKRAKGFPIYSIYTHLVLLRCSFVPVMERTTLCCATATYNLQDPINFQLNCSTQWNTAKKNYCRINFCITGEGSFPLLWFLPQPTFSPRCWI